jgi:enoyl-CoA hydratase/carnithine racemase
MSIDIEVSDGIAVVTMNRPERMNALDAEHYHGLSEAWKRIRDDPDIGAAIVTGAGDRAFTAGADLKSYIPAPPSLSRLWLTQDDQLLNRGLEIWKPVVAAVNGYCVAGGMTLLFATDVRIAADHAVFGLSEVKRGLLPGNGGTQRALEQLPHAIAMEMLLTGDPIDATTAERWGLVNRVVPGAQLMSTAREYAQRLAANAPLAVQAIKEMALRARDMDRTTGLRIEQVMLRVLQMTADAAEGAAAFGEKRPPKFLGH